MKMEIVIPIECSDGIVEINYDDILNIDRYEFFRYCLKYKTVTVEKQNDQYIYKIPKLTLGCPKEILNILLNGLSISIRNNEPIITYGTDYKLSELMYYNNMYKLTEFGYTTWGFSSKEYQPLFYYIEKEMPLINPYELISGSCQHSFNGIIDVNMSSPEFILNEKRVNDILEWMCKYNDYFDKHEFCSTTGSTIDNLFFFIVNCYNQGFFELFKEKHTGSIESLKKVYYKHVNEKRCNFVSYEIQYKEKIKIDEVLKDCKPVADYIGIKIDKN